MHTRTIGGLSVSAVGLGCNNFGMKIDRSSALRVVDAALARGVNFFDTADVYGSTFGESEAILGEVLGSRIHNEVVATKFGSPSHGAEGGASPRYIRRSLDASLNRLGVGHVDLYQLHRFDENTPIEDTVGCLADLVTRGKVREIGVSNCSPAQLAALRGAAAAVGVTIASLQNHYNLLEQSDRDKGLAECEGSLTYLPYFPLASGMLTGKYRLGAPLPPGSRIEVLGNAKLGGVLNDRSDAIVRELRRWAEAKGHAVGDAAIAWLLADRRIASVIAGATNPEQVADNCRAADWALSSDEVMVIDSVVASHST